MLGSVMALYIKVSISIATQYPHKNASLWYKKIIWKTEDKRHWQVFVFCWWRHIALHTFHKTTAD